MAEIYEPAEDSYLMSEALASEIPKLLKQNPNLSFLEIGCGSGINLETLEKIGVNRKNILGCDISNKAVIHCKSLGFNCIQSDLFGNIKGKFNLIAFNPPYLSLDEDEPEDSRLNTTAGRKGNEIIIRFLKQAKNYLAKGGKILIITTSISSSINFNLLGYRAKVLANKKLFFERLTVWECLKI